MGAAPLFRGVAMHFQRLKLSGFKSFVEPAELRIEPGLTGVVGPNGCGKSNLLEALRWVMGEASARAMRGSGMDDVIFAGSGQRPPRAFAEVALTAKTDPDDQWGGELEVVRRIERGAGSAYRVNGRDVRAKDVGLIFADAATGAHSPALVSQGRIAAVIAAKPAERRMMLEEAAGIAGLYVRRRDAEQKLRATEANLGRLEDLMAGLDDQIAALRKQARAAQRYKDVSERIRVAEARLTYARWRDAAQAADLARKEAGQAEAAVAGAQAATVTAQGAQHAAATALAQAREAQFDRRQDAAAHGQRMAALAAQLDAAEQRLADIDRQRARIEEDRAQADRVTREAALALARLDTEITRGEAALLADEARRPLLAQAHDEADRTARAAQVDHAQKVAAQAGTEAEWRVAQAALAAAAQRLARLDAESARLDAQAAALAAQPDPALALAAAQSSRDEAAQTLAHSRARRDELALARETLTAARDAAANALAGARADLAGVVREAEALARDKAARAKAAMARGKGPAALDACRVAPGWERALAAVLGRDAAAPLGPAQDEGRFWTGAEAPTALQDSLLLHMAQCPDELAARLALVRAVEADEGQALAPGEWLVTRGGHLRRWDGFVARGEGAAQAAALEADNRLADLEQRRPALEQALAEADTAHEAARQGLSAVQAEWSGIEKAIGSAADAERSALRALDQAEAARATQAQRAQDLARARETLGQQRAEAEAEASAAQAQQAALPDPAQGRAAVEAAQGRLSDTARALQQASATQAALEQALAVGRERLGGMKADQRNWQARADDATRSLAQMAKRAEELDAERAVGAAKPLGLMAQIEEGDAIGTRITADLAQAEAALAQAEQAGKAADAALAAANEALAAAREHRAGAIARAAHEDQRRQDMAGVSGDRFQCPPPLLPERFAFASAQVGSAAQENDTHESLLAERERIGPVNLVAAAELADMEGRHAESLAQQAELAEAVNRLRGSIGNLNREGRERLRAAFEAVDGHFRRLFTRLFGGGEAHLALIDSDDPLEAGLEIMAQPPGKRLQSLTLLSGGEQALTAVALIFGLFLTNPAPICVLDEVDAPLDDANIERFCDLLDVMVAETSTRYLIVTHNAVTMSRMHRLFGVTMVERGVSRLVSVDLGGAEDLLASAPAPSAA